MPRNRKQPPAPPVAPAPLEGAAEVVVVGVIPGEAACPAPAAEARPPTGHNGTGRDHPAHKVGPEGDSRPAPRGRGRAATA